MAFYEVQTPDMNDPRGEEGPLPPGAKAGLWALLGLFIGLALPYGLTPLAAAIEGGPDEYGEERFFTKHLGLMRVWMPGDPLPYAQSFKTGSEAKALEEEEEPSTPKPPTRPVIAIDDASPVEPEGAAATETPEVEEEGEEPIAPPKQPHPYERIHIAPELWEELAVHIEDPKGVMAPFYEKLAQVALNTSGEMVRISHFGDSAIAADGMPASVREALQATFGEGGHGFSLAAASNAWYRRRGVQWESRGFRTQVYISNEDPAGLYGFGGTAAVGYQGARASWETLAEVDELGGKASHFYVYYMAQPRAGNLAILVDGEEVERIEMAAESVEDRVFQLEVEDGPHRFEIRNVGGGPTKVYGVAIERGEGVVYDGLGTIGARDTRWRHFDKAQVKRMMAQRGTDLGVFMYGGNQLEDKISMARYREQLTEIVSLWAEALEGKSCLLMSAMDHGMYQRGKVVTVPRLKAIMEVQREVALEQGCAWFSLYEAMGGEGSVGRWYKERLAEGDLAHPTRKGSEALGELFFKALMQGFSEHISGVVEAAE